MDNWHQWPTYVPMQLTAAYPWQMYINLLESREPKASYSLHGAKGLEVSSVEPYLGNAQGVVLDLKKMLQN